MFIHLFLSSHLKLLRTKTNGQPSNTRETFVLVFSFFFVLLVPVKTSECCIRPTLPSEGCNRHTDKRAQKKRGVGGVRASDSRNISECCSRPTLPSEGCNRHTDKRSYSLSPPKKKKTTTTTPHPKQTTQQHWKLSSKICSMHANKKNHQLLQLFRL